jgi:hypothetical protein
MHRDELPLVRQTEQQQAAGIHVPDRAAAVADQLAQLGLPEPGRAEVSACS